jgi:hypothetical protein
MTLLKVIGKEVVFQICTYYPQITIPNS